MTLFPDWQVEHFVKAERCFVRANVNYKLFASSVTIRKNKLECFSLTITCCMWVRIKVQPVEH